MEKYIIKGNTEYIIGKISLDMSIKENGTRLILISDDSPALLRKWLSDNDFNIADEQLMTRESAEQMYMARESADDIKCECGSTERTEDGTLANGEITEIITAVGESGLTSEDIRKMRAAALFESFMNCGDDALYEVPAMWLSERLKLSGVCIMNKLEKLDAVINELRASIEDDPEDEENGMEKGSGFASADIPEDLNILLVTNKNKKEGTEILEEQLRKYVFLRRGIHNILSTKSGDMI